MMVPYTRPVDLITRTVGERVDFRDGAIVETTSEILGSFQPPTRADRRILEERGLSESVTRVLFTQATIYTANEQSSRLSDLVDVDGERFEVVATEPHGLGAPGYMLHTKAYLARYYFDAPPEPPP
jgi:hypothetical protein